MIATAVSSVVANGKAAGCRAIDLRVEGGIDLRLLPDRGLDAGDAWFAGVPLDWRSPVGETGNVADDWMLSFGGGLMVTCGLRNVGVPSEGHGQHGDYTFQRADVEAVERSGDALIVQGTISEVAALGHHLHVARTWRTYAGQGLVQLEDVVTNRGHATEPALQLYHVNLGPPLWAEGAELRLDARATRPRDADAEAFADAWRHGARGCMPGAPERVYEHDVAPGADGWCSATVQPRPARARGPLGRGHDAAHVAVGPPVLRRARPRARQLLGARRRPRPRRGPAARARAGRGAPHAAGDPRAARWR